MLREDFMRHFSSVVIRVLMSVILAVLFVIAILPVRLTVPVRAQQISPNLVPIIPAGSAYRQTNLTSDSPGMAFLLDPLIVNPWGVSLTASSPFWIANNGTSTSSLYRGDVGGAVFAKQPGMPSVTIPGLLPTGTVANTGGATDFVLPGPCAAAPCKANFIFCSLTGNIIGWSPNAPTAGSTTGVIAASHPDRVYTGLAFGNNGTNKLYAADFKNGNIDVYDNTYALTTVPGGFVDPTIPTTAGNVYHPFNVQNIGGSLYVTYAKVAPDGRSEDGVGKGFVRKFTTDGVRDPAFGINNGVLNAPWGVTLASASFGIFGGALLVGNFGEGGASINAFNPTSGVFLGTINDESGTGIVIDELWTLTFGNGGAGGDPNTLYFTAGIGEEEHGLFGKLQPTTAQATNLIKFATDIFAISEGSGHIDVTIVREGDASGSATVNFNTFDEPGSGHASQKSDYEIALSKVTFNAGETSKTIRILLVDDKLIEGNEEVSLALSNPTGTGTGLGNPNAATLTIIDNDVAAPIITQRAAVGINAAAITPARDQFRTDIGGGTVAGPNGSFGGVRREINWDGVPQNFAAPNLLPGNFFNVNSPRGAILSTTAGSGGFQVSGATTDVGPGQPAAQNFGNINPTYTATFQQFSPQRLFTALNNTITDVTFFVPGTTTRATVTSFGSVFTDVDTDSTKMQFFDVSDVLITEQFVPALSGTGTLSFLGLTIPNRPIGRVRIISGNTTLGANDAPPVSDLVVMDDFIYSEPVAAVTPTPGTNPIDDTSFFVRQQYLDFLNREPDGPGQAFWIDNIDKCNDPTRLPAGQTVAQCIEVQRITTSAAFFLSIEFQSTGVLSYLTNKAAFGSPPLYGTFEKDTQGLQKDLVFGTPGFSAQLEANKTAYFNDFVNRLDFVSQTSGLTNAQYVDRLLTNAGISPTSFAVNLTNTQEVPPTVPTGRPGSYGTATFLLDPAIPQMTFSATINNIDVSGAQTVGTADNLVAAHIHASATVAPGVNGPVVWGFFGTPFNDNNPNDSVNTPFATGVGGTFSGKWDAPEGNGTTLTAQLANIQAGRAYINFHTTQFGGGEIRGNFPSGLQTFRDSLLNGLNASTETRASVLRKVAEAQRFSDLEATRVFVFMEYAGYLRRDFDQPGFNFWLDKLNSFQGDFLNAEMVKAFLSSGEYRQRFGP
jgi:uncharacterized protein (TIGR03118 family)